MKNMGDYQMTGLPPALNLEEAVLPAAYCVSISSGAFRGKVPLLNFKKEVRYGF